VTIRVLLVDDHTVVRQGLRRILETDEEMEIVGEAGDGRTAVDLAQRFHPNVVVMDIALPELNGIEATRQIMKRNEGARVLILTMHSDDVCVRQSLKAGARGYLLKDSEDLDLLKAVKAIGRGGSFFSPAVSKVLLEGYLGWEGLTSQVIGAIEIACWDILGQAAGLSGGRGQPGAADRPRARGAPAHRRGQDQQGDRHAPLGQHQHGRDAPQAHHGEARPAQHGRDRSLRGPEEDRSVASP
jgi:CheY-like chemotaxis protein